MVQQSNFAGCGKIIAFAILMLLLGGCSEDITITFEEDERWVAEAYYQNACTSASSPYCREMARVVEEAENLGMSGTRKGEKVILEGQGYDLLEVMLDRSLCCQSAEIELRTEANGPNIYFSLKEKASDIREKDSNIEDWSWTVTLVGGKIVSGNGVSTGEQGETKWSVNWSDYGKENRRKREMDAVLTAKSGPRNPLLVPIVVAVAIGALFILLAVFWIGRWPKAFWLLLALILALISALTILVVLGQDATRSDCSPRCVNFNPSVVDLYGGECLEYYYPAPEECNTASKDIVSVINQGLDSYTEYELSDPGIIITAGKSLCACLPGLLVFTLIVLLAGKLDFRIPFTGSRQRKEPANLANQMPGQLNNAGEEEEV